MSSINTNVSALNAQYYLANTNKEMEQSMQRLSSGFKVNSAADDAAGLAIAGRMEAQTRGLTMAIKNANDAVSLAQTAEGALGEVTNMLQRIRELAVNSANSTLNDSDRLSLDNEVQALKAEIDRVGSTTTFNSQNLLDGSYSGKFQIGDKDGQTVDLKIGSAMTSALGMGGGSSGSNTVVSSRTAFVDVVAGDIEINGQALGSITAASEDMEDVLKNINDNVDNVTATGFNVVTAATIGNGVTGGDGVGGGTGMVITVTELGQSAATAFTISASSNMTELVSNINAETGGVVAASVNDSGKLVLSNNTGATITVEDDSAAQGSGFTATSTAFTGFIKLESDDGSAIRIEKGNKGLATPGSEADLAALGFRETKNISSEDGYTMVGAQLTTAGVAASFLQGDLTINGVEMFDANIATDSLAGKLNLINANSVKTGVTASSFFEQTFAIDTANLVENDIVTINGTEITVGASGVKTIDQFVTNINAQNDKTGLTATRNGNNITLSGENVQALTIGYKTGAEIKTASATLTSAMDAATTGSSGATARVLTITDADVVEGRTFTLDAGTPGNSGFDFTAANTTYTAQAGDTGLEVVQGLANLLRLQSNTFTNAVDANTIQIADNGSTDATLTFADDLAYGEDAIELTITAVKNALGAAATTYGRIKLDSVNNTPVKIDLGQGTTAANHAVRHGFLEANVGAADFDVNEPTLSAAGGSSMSGLSIATSNGASSALKTLDNAIDTVNSIRGDLGAIQNRLSYTTNNLSSIVTNTEGAKGRIMDADFAVETSKLAKTQILSQAATSMLAQANQSKQGILALLQ